MRDKRFLSAAVLGGTSLLALGLAVAASGGGDAAPDTAHLHRRLEQLQVTPARLAAAGVSPESAARTMQSLLAWHDQNGHANVGWAPPTV